MGFHPGGVKEFIKLKDTPAVFTGQAGKAAAVNIAEDALEFITLEAAKHYPLFVNTVLFNGTKDAAFAALDCGVGAAIVYIRVELGAATAGGVHFLPNDEAGIIVAEGIGSHHFSGVADRTGYVMMRTDSAGRLKWRTQGAIVGVTNITLYLLAYWLGTPKPDALIFNGAGLIAYTDLNVGVKNALAIIKFTLTDANVQGFYARLKGESQEVNLQAGCAGIYAPTTDQIAYLLVVTDSAGYIEFINQTAGRTFSIHLVSYILGASMPKLSVYDANAPVAWTDLATSLGRGYAYIRHYNKDALDDPKSAFRQDGEAFEVYHSPSNQLIATGDIEDTKVGYAFQMLDEYGTIEWNSENARSSELRIEALSH
ncbi:hypothetical protein ES703_39339 [subsurface metagenome]